MTLSDLADHLKLSTATVSLALRNNPVVAKETRAKVHEAARSLGYIYNRSAASLRTARTNLVGITVHDILNPYFAEIFGVLEAEFDKQNRTILISTHRDDIARQRAFTDALMQQGADGLIICPSRDTEAEDIDRLQAAGMPVTVICRESPGTDVPIIRGDDLAGSRAVTGHLIAQGHRRIAMVGGRRRTSAGDERYEGFRTALREAGLDLPDGWYIPEPMTQADGRAAVPALLALKPRPTAIVCFNDLVALGVMSMLRRMGVEPGRDIAVTGYDNIDGSDSTSPALTTVRNGAEEIARYAAAILKAQIDGEEVSPERILVPPELLVRESTPPPRSDA